MPQQIYDASRPLKTVLMEVKDEADMLKLVSSVWFKAALLGIFCGVGLLVVVEVLFSPCAFAVQRCASAV